MKSQFVAKLDDSCQMCELIFIFASLSPIEHGMELFKKEQNKNVLFQMKMKIV
jgi:hypothetical protein